MAFDKSGGAARSSEEMAPPPAPRPKQAVGVPVKVPGVCPSRQQTIRRSGMTDIARFRGVPVASRERSSTVRPAGGLLSGVSEEDLDGLVDRDPLRAWAEGVAQSRLYGDMSVDELAAMARAREKEFEITTLLDEELGISTPEAGGEIVAAAEKYLRVRGIDAKTADYETMAAAMAAVSR
jgi:hypothetical protein